MPVISPTTNTSGLSTAIPASTHGKPYVDGIKNIETIPLSVTPMLTQKRSYEGASQSALSSAPDVRGNVKSALSGIANYYSFKTAIENIFSQKIADENDDELRKNMTIVYSEVIKNIVGWPDQPCHELASIIMDAFKGRTPDFKLLKNTIEQTERKYFNLTLEELISGPLKKNIINNARASAHLAERGIFQFNSQATPAVAIFEWLLTTFSPVLCRGESQMREARALKNQISALNDEINALKAGGENMTRMQQRADRLEAKCLESWRALLRNPEDYALQEHFNTASQALKGFNQRRQSTLQQLQHERKYSFNANSGSSNHDPLLPVVMTTTAIAASGVGLRGYSAALVGISCFAAGGMALVKNYFSAPEIARTSANDSLNLTVEPKYQSAEFNSRFTDLHNKLEQEPAAVEPDAEGHINVRSVLDRLREMHQELGDSKAFISTARTLLYDHGLLNLLDELFLLVQEETSSSPVRRRRDVSSMALLADIPVSSTVITSETIQLAVLNRLITPSPEGSDKNEQIYFSHWRDQLPSGEDLAWLRDAPEDRQRAYKKLRDHVATCTDAMASASQKALTEYSGYAQMVQKLRTLNLPAQPEYIRLKATLPAPRGSIAIPGAVSLTLDEAWQAGVLDEMLKAPNLEVDIQLKRRRLKRKRRDEFRLALSGLTAPPDLTTLAKNPGFQLAYRKLIVTRFELSTLEAELKGKLRSDDQIRGLQIVNKFRKDDASVKAGQLTFSARDNAGQPMQIPLSGWLVLKDDEGSCVLYDADVSEQRHYFSTEREMLQFISEKRLQDDSLEAGHLEMAARAATSKDAWRLAEFFHAIKEDSRVWTERNATLQFTPVESVNYEGAMTEFAERLLTRNLASFKYDTDSQAASTRVVRLQNHWNKLIKGSSPLSLLGFTQNWIKAKGEYGQFLKDKGVYTHSDDFDPNEVLIKPLNGENVGTITEYAAYRRRREPGGDTFAMDMEVLPKVIADDDYANALTIKEKRAFADELKRVTSSAVGSDTMVTAHRRYIATLEPDAQKALNKAMQLYFRLNDADVKRGLDEALRTGFPGTDYQEHLRGQMDFSKPANAELRDTWNALERSKMQLALSMARQNMAFPWGGDLPAENIRRMSQLIEAYPGSTASGRDFMAPLTIGGVSVPGMVMFTLRDSQTRWDQNQFIHSQYVYIPEAIYGSHIFTVKDFNEMLKTSSKARNVVTSSVKLADLNNINEVFRFAASDGASSGYTIAENYDLYSEMLEKHIADADEMTISHWEVIRDAAMTGIGIMVLPACIASGPAAAVSCAGLTAVTLADDVQNAIEMWKRGDRRLAILTGLLGTLDVTDVTKGLKVLGRGAGLMQVVGRAAKHTPEVLKGVSGGMQGMLKKGDGPAELRSILSAGQRYETAFEAGWLKRDWSVSVDLETAKNGKPHGQAEGEFWELGDKWYIKERGYEGESPLIYQITTETGGSIRVIDPANPSLSGERIKWNTKKWVKDHSGLKGGGKVSDDELIIKLNSHKNDYINVAKEGQACDVKTQRVLRFMLRDKDLWEAIKDKIEVRVMKVIEGKPTKVIKMKDDNIYGVGWSGSYHVYMTVKLNNERMIIDPYVGTEDAFATLKEQEFMDKYWTGKVNEDYKIETLAPADETVKGEGPGEPDEILTYSLKDFMDNKDLYYPDIYPSHEFYYKDI